MKLRNPQWIISKPALAGLLVFLFFLPKDVQAQSGWFFNSNIQTGGGNYLFNTYSHTYSLFGGFRYQGDDFGASLSIPLTARNNQSQLTGTVEKSLTAGFGDLYGYFDYQVLSQFDNELEIYLNAQVKLPTANTGMNIGTGKADYGISATIKRTFAPYLIIGDIGYLNIGDPAGITYKNPLTYGTGIGRFFNDGEFALLLYYAGYTNIADAYDAPRQLALGLNFRASETVILSVIGSAGIGNFTPDFTLSSGLRLKL